ncbi:DUF4190 domain-containing protein [Aquibacillus koreensis]|uniref:DUF4190 domain-containing protein n=1 Tax=Aquibacillus koreensis TaxID=279446 RepID=A0A9X3WKF1_9BACI|nr:DUF4190 domain-containing protein [Aquibacillus koreensis]MCT2537578.1 DUF4190 domain-containing protein [Aquibacillus koreensis]MDC3419024.1 DUF4190 domain-containing protein [Aquibacillus koreensis]
MDESYRNQRNEEVEDAPRFGEEEADVVAARQQGAQEHLVVEDEELYSLDEAYKRDEEIAQELTANEFNRPMRAEEKETEMRSEVKTGFGWLAIILAALSFFVMPIIMGAAGIIFGFVAKGRGADTLGNTAIVAGAISIAISLFITPFV